MSSSITRPARWGTISRSGKSTAADTGLSAIFQSMAPSALVRKIRRSPRSVTTYFCPGLRSVTARGGPVGSARSTNLTSRGREVAGLDHQEAVGERDPHRGGEPQRFLLIDELVLGGRSAEPMAKDLLPPLARIAPHIEQPSAVRRPHRAAAHLGDRICKVLTGRQVADLERVVLRTVRVDRVGKELVVRADGRFRHREGSPAARQRVLVEQDLLGPAVARPPTVQLALRAELVASVVFPRPPPPPAPPRRAG